MNLKRLTKTAIIPTRATDGSAGYDLYADTDKDTIVPPHETVMLYTNIAMEIPRGWFGAIYARSGLSTRQGLRPSTCVSIIDSDYRGNIGLPIHNDTDEFQKILPHERVAQIIFQQCGMMNFEEVEELDNTDRGSNGFGSSGL